MAAGLVGDSNIPQKVSFTYTLSSLLSPPFIQMTEGSESQMKPNSNFRKLLQERIVKANPRRNLTAEEAKRLAKLEAIADKLKRGENVQNLQLQTWLSEDEYGHFFILTYNQLYK